MMTFEGFLSGAPAGAYIRQGGTCEEQAERAASMLREADYVLIGAGSGMSLAAGARYGGEAFRRTFAEFRAVYGEDDPYMQDTYSAGFYPFRDEEAYWGMWSKLALYGGADLDLTPLHKTVLDMLSGRRFFLITTNVDDQFERAGLPSDRIFATQGSYSRIQCRRGCHARTYDAVAMFREMDRQRSCGRIPTELVPRCPVCGGAMAMNLRSDRYFVQDEAWYEAEQRFSRFLTECVEGRTVLLELGVGFNTPTIIRFPFEKLCREHDGISLVRLNLGQAFVPDGMGDRAVGMDGDIGDGIRRIAKGLD